LIKNSQPFGEKIQKTMGGLTHTVELNFQELRRQVWAQKIHEWKSLGYLRPPPPS